MILSFNFSRKGLLKLSAYLNFHLKQLLAGLSFPLIQWLTRGLLPLSVIFNAKLKQMGTFVLRAWGGKKLETFFVWRNTIGLWTGIEVLCNDCLKLLKLLAQKSSYK